MPDQAATCTITTSASVTAGIHAAYACHLAVSVHAGFTVAPPDIKHVFPPGSIPKGAIPLVRATAQPAPTVHAVIQAKKVTQTGPTVQVNVQRAKK